ncbi:MAG: PIN domain-containing protein [Acidobacteria bacterium]|nr:PIN domain-containing protein [Acidobacteriota bacterium]
MADLVIDTHIVIWYFNLPALPSSAAQTAILSATLNGKIYISSISIIELIYLSEKGKIPIDIINDLRKAIDDPATAFQLIGVNRDVADELANIPRSTVPEMPDRIISATALSLGLPLITADSAISKLTNITTIW